MVAGHHNAKFISIHRSLYGSIHSPWKMGLYTDSSMVPFMVPFMAPSMVPARLPSMVPYVIRYKVPYSVLIAFHTELHTVPCMVLCMVQLELIQDTDDDDES